MIITRKRLGVTTATAAVILAGTAAGAYAAGSATSVQPRAVYACEGAGHVPVSLLSSPSARCPAGTTSIVVGAQGPQGAQGAPGPQGSQGPKGDPGAAAPAPAFGIASVLVDRGTGATPWATYSAPLLGSPAGDQAQGTFRFTCNGSADCKLSLRAHATADGWQVYPRVLIMAQHDGSGPETYCEYGDGADNNGAQAPLMTSDSVIPLGIGGTLDCGSSQAYPAGGIASEIDVPGGGSHYDVYTTLIFSKVA